MLPFVMWKGLCCPTITHTVSLAIKRALPVWLSHLVSVFSTHRADRGLSLLALLMWRDDTCGFWIERHKGFQIKNMARRLMWEGVLFLLFIQLEKCLLNCRPEEWNCSRQAEIWLVLRADVHDIPNDQIAADTDKTFYLHYVCSCIHSLIWSMLFIEEGCAFFF